MKDEMKSVMKDQLPRRVFFVGVGGTAMGAAAIACTELGIEVFGSDSGLYPPMSVELERSSVQCQTSYSPENIRLCQPDLVVVGNAISRGNPELEYCLSNRIPIISLAEFVYRAFIAGKRSIVIAGTHGKTTTTSITAWIFRYAGRAPGFMIGGVVPQLLRSCTIGGTMGGGPAEHFIVEGDEYDTAFFDKRSKFIHYWPDVAVINNVEFDHADIFTSIDDVKRTFSHMIRLIPKEGLLLANGDDNVASELSRTSLSRVMLFGLGNNNHVRAQDIDYSPTGSGFTVTHPDLDATRVQTRLVGEYNLRNALAAFSVAQAEGINVSTIVDALATFEAPKRRLESLGIWRGIEVIDDFAHHPSAIRLTIQAARQRYPKQRILVCFEPRSNTSTRAIFQHETAEALSAADMAFIGRVNRADRYAPEQRLNVPQLLESIGQAGVPAFSVNQDIDTQSDWAAELIDMLDQNARPGDVLLLCSNGDLGGLRQRLFPPNGTNS